MLLHHKPRYFPLFPLAVLLLLSCANPKADYEEVRKIQAAAEQVIGISADYDVRISECDNVIRALEGLLNKHKEGEWAAAARADLGSWQSRKAALQNEINSLIAELSGRLRLKAAEESRRKHPFSSLELIYLENQTRIKQGNNLLVKETYSVRLLTGLFGIRVMKLTTTVSGGVAMDSKKVFVDEGAQIRE
ncbi:MAG: hypothetical protein FJ217_09520 [Ignavibacteria bacterium]|nr:hypothetical protein [Ignavibacteria bacterium]